MTHAPAHRHLWSGLASDDADAEVSVLGIPFDNATSLRKGAAQAPDRIRAITPHVAPVTEEGVRLAGLAVRDYGNVPADLNWERYFGAVKEQALEALEHPFTLFIGGDHSVTIPLTDASDTALTGQLGYIQIDSHTDLMDMFQGHSWSHACTARRVLELPSFDTHHTAFVGIRSWLDEELDFLDEHPEVHVHTARSIHLRGIDAVALDVAARLADVDAVYLSLDIDGLDPAFAPGTGTAEAGGLSSRQLLEFLRIIFTRLPVRVMDIVEVAPPLDHADVTSMAAIKVIYEVFGMISEGP